MASIPSAHGSESHDDIDQNLLALWQSAIRLREYIERRWEATPLPPDAKKVTAWERPRGPHAEIFDKLVPPRPPKDPFDRHFERVAATVVDDLVRGLLTGLGRRRVGEALLLPERIEQAFWLDASYPFAYGAAAFGDRYYDQVRVLPAQPTSSGPGEQSLKRRRRGRRSQDDDILGAIVHYVSENARWMAENSPDDRKAAIRKWIARKHKTTVTRLKGYADSTIEKYETIFRDDPAKHLPTKPTN